MGRKRTVTKKQAQALKTARWDSREKLRIERAERAEKMKLRDARSRAFADMARAGAASS